MDLSSELWFHGLITREEACKRLFETSYKDGTFLVRGKSTGTSGINVLSVVFNKQVVHYEIKVNKHGKIGIHGGPLFPNPVKLIEYHKKHKILPTKLCTPCLRADDLSLELYHNVTHSQLKEATQAILLSKGIDDDAAVNYFKNIFGPKIGDILHEQQLWFHGKIPRDEAFRRLESNANKEGMYLIRERGVEHGTFVLTLCHANNPHQYLIKRDNNGNLNIESGRLFDNLMAFVSYYTKVCDGLLCLLKEPCKVTDFEYRSKKEMNFENILLSPSIQEELCKEIQLKHLKKYKKAVQAPSPGVDKKSLTEHTSVKNPVLSQTKAPSTPEVHHKAPSTPEVHHKAPSTPEVRHKAPSTPEVHHTPAKETCKSERSYDEELTEVVGYSNLLECQENVTLALDTTKLNIQSVLGRGNFGSVNKGTYELPNGKVIPVAIKTLKDDDLPNNKKEIHAEAGIMSKLDHPHIVRLIGVGMEPNLTIVMELCNLGQLNTYLKANPSIKIIRILKLMLQVNKGMLYLQSQNFIHRDLAARNVLVMTEKFVKISDFGMSRAVGAGKEYYRAERSGSWPIRWYAPECVEFYKFSFKGDVWSYGVTMWEALTYGSAPYAGLKGRAYLEHINNGERLPQPHNCPNEIFLLMDLCWKKDPTERPTFKEIENILWQYIWNQNLDKPAYVIPEQ